MTWRREDGAHFDPWLRIHERVGRRDPRCGAAVDGDGGARRQTGRTGPGCASPPTASTSSRARWRHSSSRTASAGTSSRTSGSCTASRPVAARVTRLLDETVAGERVDRVGVELVDRPGPRSDEPQKRRRAAAGMSLRSATACAAARSVGRATGSARRAGRPRSAVPREADGRAEIEERLQRLRPERVAGALLDPRDVRIDREHGLAERLVADRRGGVRGRRPEARSGRPASRARRSTLRGPVQVDRAPVVAEPLPGADHVGGRSGRERCRRRPALEPREPAGMHALDLRLLQHHLADENRVRILRLPPGRSRPFRLNQARSSSSTGQA